MSKVRIKENSWMARLAAGKLRSSNVAMVIGHTIHLHNVSRKDFMQSTTWLRHELKHVEQVKKLGLMRFLILYLWESLRRGYYQNKFEAEARAAEKDENIIARFNIDGAEEKYWV